MTNSPRLSATATISGPDERQMPAKIRRHQNMPPILNASGARDAGKLRSEGKDYVVRDGDVMNFRFNV